MGRTVTVSSVRLSLVSRSGADLALRAGSKPIPAWLPQVASASNAGGTVQFRLSTPAHARYLLIWFTKLPARQRRHLPGQRLQDHRPGPALTRPRGRDLETGA